MSDPRYFGIALTLDELHKSLGLPDDVTIHWAEMGRIINQREAKLLVNLSGPAEKYDGHEEGDHNSFFRPDIRTSTVSQVVIHPLRER
jgi:hypothetical protein